MDGPVRANRPDVIDEAFDGEVVIVNLQSGCYYAVDAFGSRLWELLAPGRDAATVAAALAAVHDSDVAELTRTVTAFVERLREEALVVPTGEPVELPGLDGTGAPPATPTLERFDDVRDLLALDPIHDIDLDGDGWPIRPAAA